MSSPDTVKTTGADNLRDALIAANAAAVEAGRAKKRTADAATDAVNRSMVYVARKLMKHALKRCSAEMRAEDGMSDLVGAVKMTDQLIPRIMWDAQVDYRIAKRHESEAAKAAVVAGNDAAAALAAENIHVYGKEWVERYEDAEEHKHACFLRGVEAANKDIASIVTKFLMAADIA